ncbi:hypothetical protein ACIO3O_06745 [Streptomyces sp. NPDC087440]|uniref:hypothetical protein n=1 Tax=Streptomyces sp. NPDC087440 TaxID=3365790 RepID=UPI00380AD09B
MNASLRTRCAHALTAGVLTAALLSAGTAASAAPSPKPSPSASVAAAAITVKASANEVDQGGTVTFTGRTKGLKVGSKLLLQHKNGTKWTTLKASTTVKNGSGYTLDAKLLTKGKEQLRVKGDDDTVSPTVKVTVK